MPYLKIFSVVNLFFLTVVFFATEASFYWSFDYIVFIITFLFLATTPIFYAFHIYFNLHKKIITLLESVFGFVFVYQVIVFPFFPFLSLLDVLLAQRGFLQTSPILYKIFFILFLLIFLSVSMFYAFKYLHTLKNKQKNNFTKFVNRTKQC